MPSVNVVYGNQIVVKSVGPVERALRFVAKPFVQVWVNRDIVQAILRRELSERFKGSVVGWLWAVVAPLLAIAVYTYAFTTNLKLPITDSTSMLMRLNSSKQHHEPQPARPLKNLAMATCGTSFPSPKIPNLAFPVSTSFLPRRLA